METLIRITPWIDPVVDRRGHDPRSTYVEQFWLGTLGPASHVSQPTELNRSCSVPVGFAGLPKGAPNRGRVELIVSWYWSCLGTTCRSRASDHIPLNLGVQSPFGY